MVYPEAGEARTRRRGVVFRNLGGGKLRGVTGPGGAGRRGGAHRAAGAPFGDFDNDGDIDILIVNHNEPPSLLRNDMSGAGHWLKVMLDGRQVEPQRHRRTVDAALWRAETGAGRAERSPPTSVTTSGCISGWAVAKADLEIRWPIGRARRLAGVAADQLVVIREGSGIVRKESFARRRTG